MATKTTSATKSNTAKSKISQKTSFNPKQLIVLMIAIVALIGFVFIFLTRAGTQKEYVYYAGYTTANAKNSVEVWDPTTNALVKAINLPAYPAQTNCASNPPYWYDSVVELRSANRAFVLPTGCSGSTNKSVLLPSIDTATHTYTGKALSLTFNGLLDVVPNEVKKQIYVFDQTSQTVVAVDGVANTALKTLNIAMTGGGVFPVGIAVSGDGASLVVLYGSDLRSAPNPATYKNVVVYDTTTFAEKGRFKANEAGFAFRNRTHSRIGASVSGKPVVYAVAQASSTAGSTNNPTKLQLATINTANYTAAIVDLPTTNPQFDDIAQIQKDYIHIMTMKGYDPATQNSSPLLLKYNVLTSKFESAPGASINTQQSGVMYSSTDPLVGIITTFNTLSTYNFSTGVVAPYVQRSGTPILGGVISSTTTTVTPPPTTTVTPTPTTTTTTVAPPPTTTVQPPAPAGTTG